MNIFSKLNGCSEIIETYFVDPVCNTCDDDDKTLKYYNDMASVKFEERNFSIFGGNKGKIEYSNLKEKVTNCNSDDNKKLDDILSFYFCGDSDKQINARIFMATYIADKIDRDPSVDNSTESKEKIAKSIYNKDTKDLGNLFDKLWNAMDTGDYSKPVDPASILIYAKYDRYRNGDFLSHKLFKGSEYHIWKDVMDASLKGWSLSLSDYRGYF